METKTVTSAKNAPQHLQRAVKVALAVGAAVRVSNDGEQLFAQFKTSDSYYFDPENTTLHALEALGEARLHGLVFPGVGGRAWIRQSLVIRTVFSVGDVRVQIGSSKWFADSHLNTTAALRRALCDALASYYDEVIAPYTEA